MASIDIVLGAQWGAFVSSSPELTRAFRSDEGKGKMVDVLGREAQICARAQKPLPAGHTVVANGVSYDFHLLPSGLLHPNCRGLIGSGTVVHVPTFFKEKADLEAKGLAPLSERLHISDRCHIITDCHIQVDGLEEQELGGKSIGTTKRGIGPTYSTMAARNGITIREMLDEEVFERKLRQLASGFKKRFGDLLVYDIEEEVSRFVKYREELRDYIVDAVPYMDEAQKANNKILIEGAQAVMLDVNFGTYPFVTSSNTTLGGIFTGLGINPRQINHIVGVVKAYTTRVGGGAFPTEQLNEVGEKLQKVGHEVGVSTGRSRRCGWLDLVVVKYSAQLNHYTAINLTKLDILDTFPTIKVAVAYKYKGTDDVIPSFPADLKVLEEAEIVYEELEGWNTPTTGAKTYSDLPKNARAYIEFIEEFVGVKVRWIGTGPKREDLIDREAKN
ncbi:adenylosuccinate synthetase [Colletotrichum sojae]|uniref:Adenylosuccinate synthetase n=1 Tax=Colletotrichum sojae TaxID=2175907 RepID=A0A8H6J8W0_9PEZI|nr:adenylosuccinate synthetase [Colletotrichum sojae]